MKVVSFSRVVPYDGIPHAGGEYYLHHIRHLANKHEVVVVAPDSPRNRAALESYNCPAQVILTLRQKLISPFAKVQEELRPASAPRALAHAIRSNSDLQLLIKSADAVEFQWSENASLIKDVRKLNAGLRVVTVMHDVLQQKYKRRVSTERGLKRRARAILAYASSALLEPKRLRQSDEVIVFSAKDKELVEASGTRAPVTVVPPPLHVSPELGNTSKNTSEVLFTGAMDRPENNHGILWFIEKCWPEVRKAHPAAILTVAGASPSERLLELSAADSSISVTGYVDSLDPFYLRSRLFIVPLFQGAGIKFKTITAMLHGLPVVATTVGAEGVGPAKHFAHITDNSDDFSESVIRVLNSPEPREHISGSTREWAVKTYGLDQFHASLSEVYDQLAIVKDRKH
jgi:glycosyltransferase involved in cell wall biosynthesis